MAFENYSGNLIGGIVKKSSQLGNQSSSQTNALIGGRTVIIELKMVTTKASSALGLRKDDTDIDPSISNEYDTYDWATYIGKEYSSTSHRIITKKSYDFKTKSSGNKIYVDSNSEHSPRKVFALHSEEQISIYPVHLVFDSNISRAYMGYGWNGLNKWVTHTDGDGNIYKAITVNSNDQFIETTLSVEKGKRYTFNMHTVSEAGWDGIIISTSALTSGSVKNDGIARCSGVDAKSSYTYTSTSDGTIYIYFKTDSANLGESHTSFDTHLGADITTYDGVTTGDIEIIVESITTTTQVTLEKNGATGGNTSL